MQLNKKDIENIHAVKAYLDKNYHHNLRIQDMTRMAAMNRAKLQEGFKLLFLKSMREYHVQLRMIAAQQFLTDSKQTISQVAYKVGYRSVSGFTKAFRRYFGVRPSYWRNNL